MVDVVSTRASRYFALLLAMLLVLSFLVPTHVAMGQEEGTNAGQEPAAGEVLVDGDGDDQSQASAVDDGDDQNQESAEGDASEDSEAEDVDGSEGSTDDFSEGSEDVTSEEGETQDSEGSEDAANSDTSTGDAGEATAETDDEATDEAEPKVLMVVTSEGEDGEGTMDVFAADSESEVTTIAAASTGLDVTVDTPANVVTVLVGDGISVSGVKYSGSPNALGSFTGGDGIIGFPSGIIMSTGNVTDVVGPNDSSSTSTNNGEPGDPLLTDLADQQTFDAAILSFDFVPEGNMIEFKYVFASEEYNEYVGEYNDVFAFYVNGQSCAMVGGEPVSVNAINASSNSSLYVDNTDGHLNTEMDGMTVVLTCTAEVTPGATNTMSFGIADSGDGLLDAAIFLQAKSFIIAIPEPGTPGSGVVVPEVSEEVPTEKSYGYKHQSSGEVAKVTQLPETGTGSGGGVLNSALLLAGTLGVAVLAFGSRKFANK